MKISYKRCYGSPISKPKYLPSINPLPEASHHKNFTYSVPGKFSDYYLGLVRRVSLERKEQLVSKDKKVGRMKKDLGRLKEKRNLLESLTEEFYTGQKVNNCIIEENLQYITKTNRAATVIQSYVRRMLVRKKFSGQLVVIEKNTCKRFLYNLDGQMKTCKDILNEEILVDSNNIPYKHENEIIQENARKIQKMMKICTFRIVVLPRIAFIHRLAVAARKLFMVESNRILKNTITRLKRKMLHFNRQKLSRASTMRGGKGNPKKRNTRDF